MENNDANQESTHTINAIRGNVLSDQCPSREILKHVTSRWAVLIFFVMRDGSTYRFSELRRTIQGVSEKMLAQTLQALEKDNFISRTAYPVVPPKVEYNLTATGLEVAEHVLTLTTWLEDNIVQIMEAKVGDRTEVPSG